MIYVVQYIHHGDTKNLIATNDLDKAISVYTERGDYTKGNYIEGWENGKCVFGYGNKNSDEHENTEKIKRDIENEIKEWEATR